jgi:DnaJ-class molecular chaperone
MNRLPRKEFVEDDRWKLKGHAHPRKYSEPRICRKCKGTGIIKYEHLLMDSMCDLCQGEGVEWE